MLAPDFSRTHMSAVRETSTFYKPVILMCPSSSRRMLKDRRRKQMLYET